MMHILQLLKLLLNLKKKEKVAKGSLVYLDYTPFHGFFEAAYLSVCHI
jgi:hypothetical protein